MAISVQLFVGILISSLQVGLVDAVTGTSPHITVSPAESGGTMENWESVRTDIAGVDSVTAVTVSAYSPTLVATESKTISAGIKGFDMASADEIYRFSDSVEGTLPSSADEVMVGTVLNDELGLRLNDILEITNADRTARNVTVTGFFTLGSSFTDSWVVTPLETCQAIFDLGNNVTSVEIQVADVFSADVSAAEIAVLLDDPALEVANWKDINADLLSALQSQSLSSYMIQAFVLISVVIAITSILAITVLQKSRQIGILKAMGIKDRQASLIFLYQGLMFGILGAVGGILIGLFLLYGFMFGTSTGGEPLINLIIDFRFIALSGAVSVISAVVASLLPARRSSALSPVEVIRNG